jgi:outer membrane protein OmpA-like peptidoglycan-associated protein
MGGSDLYITRRTEDTVWSEPQNLGYPINTSYDEMSLSLTADGLTGFFASNRNNVAGNFDLYEMNWPENLRPSPVSFVKGYVYDSLTEERLTYASIFVSDAETGKELYHYTSNRGDGSFVLTLPANKQYAMYVDRIGYQSISDTIVFDKLYLGEPMAHNYALLPYGYEKPKTDTLIATIFFQKNSTTLSDSARESLKAILAPWANEKQLSIMINGYTDNSGTPMLNEQLSYVRADLVSKEVIKNGFAPETIESKGWGEANPITGNDTEEHRDMNRRVEIVIRH